MRVFIDSREAYSDDEAKAYAAQSEAEHNEAIACPFGWDKIEGDDADEHTTEV